MAELVKINHCESFLLSSRLFARLGIRRESKLVDGFYLTLWAESSEKGDLLYRVRKVGCERFSFFPFDGESPPRGRWSQIYNKSQSFETKT